MAEARADEAFRRGIYLDAKGGRAAHVIRQVAGNDGAQLDDRVVALPLDPTGPNDDTLFVEREIGRVEKERLADLGIQRVEGQRCDG